MKRPILTLSLLLILFPVVGCNWCGVCIEGRRTPNTQYLVEWKCRNNIRQRVFRANEDGVISVPDCEMIRRISSP